MRKNSSSQIVGAQLVSATDGSAFTGAVTCYVTGDGGTQAVGSVGSGAATHEGNGFHSYAPAQAETNYDLVAFTFVGAGAIPVTVQVYTSFPQTGDSFARIGANGASLSAIPWNAAWDAEVQSECADALNAYDPPTNAEMTARTLATADYATSTALAAVAAYIDTEVAAILEDTGTTIPATLATLATASALATVDANVDAILVDTGTTLPATLASLSTFDSSTDTVILAAQTHTGAVIPTVGAVTGAVGSVTAPVALETGAVNDATLGTITELLPANIKRVNDATLTGNGTSGNPWRPA